MYDHLLVECGSRYDNLHGDEPELEYQIYLIKEEKYSEDENQH